MNDVKEIVFKGDKLADCYQAYAEWVEIQKREHKFKIGGEGHKELPSFHEVDRICDLHREVRFLYIIYYLDYD